MIILISPAKTLDFSESLKHNASTTPNFIGESEILMTTLKKLSIDEIGDLMSISKELADLTHNRINNWSTPHDLNNCQNALCAFKGEAYSGFNAPTLSSAELNKAQSQLIILSGLYGVLRPLDAILPYRLEMATKLKNPTGTNLYQFWRDKITTEIGKRVKASNNNLLINLASEEYFKVVNMKKVDCQLITPQFLDFSGGNYKTISVFAKKARGAMARFLCSDDVATVEHLQAFNDLGYHYDSTRSSESSPVFIR